MNPLTNKDDQLLEALHQNTHNISTQLNRIANALERLSKTNYMADSIEM